jgi:septum site-determining protein MinC
VPITYPTDRTARGFIHSPKIDHRADRAEAEDLPMDAQIESSTEAPRPSREAARTKSQAFELKGMVAPLTALRLRTHDTGAIAGQLVAKVAQMSQFFQDAAVLVDLAALGEDAKRVHFGELAALLRSCKMVPVAVTNVEGEARARAASAGFGYVAPSTRTGGRSVEIRNPMVAEVSVPVEAPREEGVSALTQVVRPAEPAVVAKEQDAAPAPRRARVAHRSPMVIRQPVRSGQMIYAEATDLVVLAPVNSGAEVIADGHVHIYSTLRGRAVAGARGMTDARIFCQKLDAEFVAISGAYLLSDDLPAEHKGKAVQIHLEEGVCRVTPL